MPLVSDVMYSVCMSLNVKLMKHTEANVQS